MSISSIHIGKGNAGYLAHNDRTTHTKNSIFKDEKNETSHSAKDAFKLYRDELKNRAEAYTKRTGQKLQKKAVTHLSAIVNLNQNHTLQDLEPLIKHLEKTLDTKVFQVAIHRDEGHINDKKEAVKNYHAHIEFMGLDSTGNSIRRKLTRSYLKDLQTKTAELLQMERGKENSKAKRLDTYEFKKHKEKEEKTVKKERAKQKDLKEEISKLRAELKENKATREDYAKLEATNKELKEKIKSKDLTIDALQAEMATLSASLIEKDAQIVAEKEEQEKIIGRSIEIIKVQTAQKDKRIETLEEEIVQKDKRIETLESKNMQNLKQISRTVSQLNDSTKLMRTLKNDLKAKDEQIIELREKTAKNSNSAHPAIKFVKNSDEVIDKALKEAFISDKLKAQVKVTKTNNARGDVAILKNFDEESIFADPEISQSSSCKRVVEKAINRTVSAVTKKIESFVKALETVFDNYLQESEEIVNKKIVELFNHIEEKKVKSAFEKLEEMREREKAYERSRDDDNDFYMMR